LLSVEEMTNAYGIIANGGAQITPFTIDKVLDRKGNILYERHHEKKQVLNEEQAFILSRLMEGMFDERLNGSQMRVTGATIDEQISRPVAGKSGSTPTDSWMIGFTPQLVTGVWVGYDDNRKIEKVKELAYAKKIWVKVMEESLKELPVVTQEKPDGIVAVLINPQNGKLATEACPIKKMTYYVENTEPTLYCTEHIKHDPNNDEDDRGKKNKDDGWWKQFLEKLF
jgi:penicillin-binding protein 2D